MNINKTLHINPYLFILYRILAVTVFLAFTQILFWLFNSKLFSVHSFYNVASISVGVLHFSVMVVCFLMIPYAFFVLLPLPWGKGKYYWKICDVYYYLASALLFLFNCTDIIFYRFTFRRMTADIFNFLEVGGDFDKLLPVFLKDYWYMVLLYIAFLILFIWVVRRVKIKEVSSNKTIGYYIKNGIYFVVFIALMVIGMRGGVQLRPMNIIHAGRYTNAENMPLVVNTPFSIIRTWQKETLSEVHYFPEEELHKIYAPVKQYLANSGEQPDNIVIIILESFSSEFIGGISGKKSYTPFLDSLIQQSLTYRGLANCKRSIDGIPAILAGMPLLMSDSYITSPYSGNHLNSIPGLLKTKGYKTSFFHGGTNGTMGFDAFCKTIGIDKYYGRKEYNNEKDYDGNWGIFDEPFLQYAVKEISKQNSQPFCTTVYTLSSHHPYTLPKGYENKFDKGTLPIHKTIGYADYALMRFFEAVSKTNWYNNTLFVITADHAAGSKDPYYKNAVGLYEIPVIFYHPSKKITGSNIKFVQQTDIMPSILNYVGYEKPFVSFGESIFDSSAVHFHATYVNEKYQLIKNDYLLYFDGVEPNQLYDLKQDSLLKKNIINVNLDQEKQLTIFLKALIQQYNNRMRDNKNSTENAE